MGTIIGAILLQLLGLFSVVPKMEVLFYDFSSRVIGIHSITPQSEQHAEYAFCLAEVFIPKHDPASELEREEKENKKNDNTADKLLYFNTLYLHSQSCIPQAVRSIYPSTLPKYILYCILLN